MNAVDFSAAVSATEADWDRERIRGFWDPGRKLLRSIRKYQAAKHRETAFANLIARYWALNHWFWSLVTQSEIHLNCSIAGGLLLPHPTGIIIHPACEIGPNCLIFHQVTLAGAVKLDGHCDIGAGAKILGPVRLGRHVQVGANAVVLQDVTDGNIVVGIPARPVSS
ncbi:serine O-acetyltransferase [Erythrobacter litoralis]|uniref:serine O-acetyltransferase n=1 Tax=Erythrobacter litoralis TaxID=39960 RepID=UPI0018F8732C|nr:serine acetyltransferase [Erythrobacter litoralis]